MRVSFLAGAGVCECVGKQCLVTSYVCQVEGGAGRRSPLFFHTQRGRPRRRPNFLQLISARILHPPRLAPPPSLTARVRVLCRPWPTPTACRCVCGEGNEEREGTQVASQRRRAPRHAWPRVRALTVLPLDRAPLINALQSLAMFSANAEEELLESRPPGARAQIVASRPRRAADCLLFFRSATRVGPGHCGLFLKA
jgi:hypothetical protein